MRWLAVCVASVALLISTAYAEAKQFGVHTPSGRRIYEPEETFGQAIDSDDRHFVMETAIGAGPEGNLAMLLGWLNQPVRKVDLYLGVGFEANPATLYTLAARRTFDIGIARPYLNLGYLLKDTHAVGLVSHSAFLEIGNSWILHRTYRLGVGVGLRYIIATRVKKSSLLKEDRVDSEFLDEQLDDIYPLLPTVALRFSRAF